MIRSPLRLALLLTATFRFVTPAGAQALPDWVAVDSAARTVMLTLVAESAPEPGTGTISGHRGGDLQLQVPQGWTVQWNWRNADTIRSHSLVVMAEREKLPAEGGQPAIDGALSRMVKAGLKPGQKDETTFVAVPGGWYWMLCGVQGRVEAGPEGRDDFRGRARRLVLDALWCPRACTPGGVDRIAGGPGGGDGERQAHSIRSFSTSARISLTRASCRSPVAGP
jgi:hypothetical protein